MRIRIRDSLETEDLGGKNASHDEGEGSTQIAEKGALEGCGSVRLSLVERAGIDGCT
jgi:hypothetical protein